MIPELVIPAVLATVTFLSIYIACNTQKFFQPFKRLKEELIEETANRDALFAGTGVPKNTDFKLNRLDWPITYRQFRIVNLFIGLVLGILSIVFLDNSKLAIISALVWYLFAHSVVDLKYKKYKEKIDEQAQISLQLLAETYNLTDDLIEAFVLVIPSAREPFKSEMERVVKENRTGKDLDLCLREFADRCDNKDIDLFVSGVILARHYGTDVNLVIEETAEIIRERINLREELENELKGKGFTITLFLIVIPIMITGLLIKSPDAQYTFLHTSKGQNLLCFALIIEYIAWYLSKRKGVMEQL